MRELKNFNQTKKVDEKKENINIEKSTEKIDENDVKRMIDERSGKSEEELLDELKSKVNESKSQGKFNDKELNNFKKTVLPFLNEEQKSKLDEIIKLIT